jgi:hypothetical protein
MKFYKWFIKICIIALLSLAFYGLSSIETNSQMISQTRLSNILPYCVVLLACCKVAYILYSTYKKILEAVQNNILYHSFLLFVLANMTLAISSFAADYWNIYAIAHTHFQGIDENFVIFEQIFECLYFSMLTYSYFGYGEIMPMTIPSKILVMMEVGLAFLTMIFVLADFIGLKESLREISKK